MILIAFRLFRHNRRSGMTLRRAFIRAWAKAWEPDHFQPLPKKRKP